MRFVGISDKIDKDIRYPTFFVLFSNLVFRGLVGLTLYNIRRFQYYFLLLFFSNPTEFRDRQQPSALCSMGVIKYEMGFDTKLTFLIVRSPACFSRET